MIRKIQMVWLALFAVFAFSAVATTSAFAEPSKILASGLEIKELTPIEINGELLLEDMLATGPPNIVCSGIFDGMIEPEGTLAYIEELLTLGKELLAGALENGSARDLIECTDLANICSNPVNLEVNLNGLQVWHIEILLDEALAGEGLTVFLAHFLNTLEIEELLEVGVVQPVYTVDCNTILGLIEDVCEGLSSARLYMEGTSLLGSFNSLELMEPEGANSEATNCSVGGVAQSLLVSVGKEDLEEDTLASGGLITANNGLALTLSP